VQHSSVPFKSHDDVVCGSPDPMDMLSYNILQCSKLLSNILCFLCCRATEAIECSCGRNQHLSPPHEGRDVVQQQQIKPHRGRNVVAQQQQIFTYLTEAGVCSIAVAVSNAIQRYTTLFSGILGISPHWFINLLMMQDAMSSSALCQPYLVSCHCDYVFKDELNRPCAIGVLSRYMSLYGFAILYRTPRSLFESFSTHVTCTVYNLKQKIYNILRSRFGFIVFAPLPCSPLNRYGYGSLQNLLFSKLLCSLIPFWYSHFLALRYFPFYTCNNSSSVI
jgi:hypothetical protein